MSRIRSQLDSILGSEGTQPQSGYGYADPRPAYPVQPPAPAYQPPMAPAQPVASARPAPNAPELEALHRSLEQLTRKIAGMQKPDSPGAPDAIAEMQRRSQMEAAMFKTHLDQQISGMGQLTSELRSGFTGMRQELNQTAQSIQNGVSSTLSQDLQRISDGIAALQNDRNLHPDYAEQMQAELNNLNAGITQLLDKPTGQVDLSGVTQAIESNYSDLVSRLDLALTQRGNEMPALDVPDYTNQLSSINSRLEEMTRAVVSLTVNPDNTIEHHAFERIEARLASLAKTVDELAEYGGYGSTSPQIQSDTIASQIAKLSDKLDNLNAMGAAGEALGHEIFPDISELATRIDTLQNDVGLIAANLESAIGQGNQNGPAHFSDDAVAQFASLAPDLSPIEQHLAGLAARMDDLANGVTENPNATGQEILSVMKDLVDRVAGLEQLAAGAQEEMGQPMVADLTSLEAQLAEITRQLGNLPAAAGGSADLAPITDRLDNIEGQIAASRDIVIDIATEAAQRAVASGAGGEETASTLAAMMEEIRSLRDGASMNANAGAQQHSDAQLAEIGSTMAEIANRLARMEDTAAQSAYQPESHQIRSSAEHARQNTQFAHSGNAANVAENTPDFDLTNVSQDPLPVIEDAPSIDMAEETEFGLADAHGSDPSFEIYGESAEQVSSEASAIEEDVPLAPGSGMPDLETLVQRATRKKKAMGGASGSEGQPSQDDGLSDLMAAARRAAQAASVEAESVRDAAPKKKKSRLALGKKMPGISKPGLPGKKILLMSAAAIAVVAGGLFVSQSLFGGGSDESGQVSGFETPLTDQQGSDASLEEADEVMQAEPAREIDMAGGSTLLSPEAADGEPQILDGDEEESFVETENPDVETADGAMPIEQDSLPASGEMPSEDLGNLAFRQAVASGNGDALFEAGKRYTDGQIVPRDLSEAVKWYTKAAEAGHAPAQYRLGNFFEKGHGVEANPAEAVKWYEMAAAQGNALAMHNLAVLNAMGVVSGDADMPTAVSWFEKAADLGVKDSQVNLGILFTKGMGVQEDLEKAYKWFAIAAKGGDADAAKKRDTVAQAMRPEQLEKARGEAEIWKPGKLDAAANIARVADEWKPKVDAGKLTKAEMVKLAQQMLAKAGFDAGPADGMMGEKTRNAIAAFQEANGMTVDGTVSPGLLEALDGKVNI